MIPSLLLNDGNSIPQVGFGTWPLTGEDAAAAVSAALEVGYRHVDTARKYNNEGSVGEGIRRSGVDRADIYITTKLDGEFQGDDRAIEGLRGSLELLGTDYVDLLLIHWPLPGRGEFVSTWRTFERLRAEGLARSIGVSNFTPAHLDILLAETDVVPAINQIQLSPVIQRREQRAYNEAHGIVTESWSPIMGVLDEAVVKEVAEKHGRTPAQVVLRWHVQNELVVIPKSVDPSRMAENLDIFDFSLDPGDLAKLDTLDGGPDAGVDSDTTGH
ncbi:MAG: aldo/keto reductase [Salinibacterium sp.]|nr:aldo/keto reductase [Salinibacterium sp.]